jgi:hypothetical protein
MHSGNERAWSSAKHDVDGRLGREPRSFIGNASLAETRAREGAADRGLDHPGPRRAAWADARGRPAARCHHEMHSGNERASSSAGHDIDRVLGNEPRSFVADPSLAATRARLRRCGPRHLEPPLLQPGPYPQPAMSPRDALRERTRFVLGRTRRTSHPGQRTTLIRRRSVTGRDARARRAPPGGAPPDPRPQPAQPRSRYRSRSQAWTIESYVSCSTRAAFR